MSIQGMQTYQTSAAEISACDWFLKSVDVSANNLNGDKFSAVTPGRDDEERLDEETPKKDLFNKN